jgi:hypothetical protein
LGTKRIEGKERRSTSVEAPRLLTSAPVVCSTAAALAATGPAGWWQPNVASVARQVELWRAAHRQARPEAAAAGEPNCR